MNVGFDLQALKIDLERTNDLLCIFQEFICDESPERATDLNGMSYDTASNVFVSRMEEYASLIDAAQVRLMEMVDDVNSELQRLYPEHKEVNI